MAMPNATKAASDQILQRRRNIQGSITFKPQKLHRTVLTRMEDSSVGPFSLIYKGWKEKRKIRIWTRTAAHIRSLCTGYVAAFDKYWNMVLRDVDEIYRDPVLYRQQIGETKKRIKCKKKKKRFHDRDEVVVAGGPGEDPAWDGSHPLDPPDPQVPHTLQVPAATPRHQSSEPIQSEDSPQDATRWRTVAERPTAPHRRVGGASSGEHVTQDWGVTEGCTAELGSSAVVSTGLCADPLHITASSPLRIDHRDDGDLSAASSATQSRDGGEQTLPDSRYTVVGAIASDKCSPAMFIASGSVGEGLSSAPSMRQKDEESDPSLCKRETPDSDPGEDSAPEQWRPEEDPESMDNLVSKLELLKNQLDELSASDDDDDDNARQSLNSSSAVESGDDVQAEDSDFVVIDSAVYDEEDFPDDPFPAVDEAGDLAKGADEDFLTIDSVGADSGGQGAPGMSELGGNPGDRHRSYATRHREPETKDGRPTREPRDRSRGSRAEHSGRMDLSRDSDRDRKSSGRSREKLDDYRPRGDFSDGSRSREARRDAGQHRRDKRGSPGPGLALDRDKGRRAGGSSGRDTCPRDRIRELGDVGRSGYSQSSRRVPHASVREDNRRARGSDGSGDDQRRSDRSFHRDAPSGESRSKYTSPGRRSRDGASSSHRSRVEDVSVQNREGASRGQRVSREKARDALDSGRPRHEAARRSDSPTTDSGKKHLRRDHNRQPGESSRAHRDVRGRRHEDPRRLEVELPHEHAEADGRSRTADASEVRHGLTGVASTRQRGDTDTQRPVTGNRGPGGTDRSAADVSGASVQGRTSSRASPPRQPDARASHPYRSKPQDDITSLGSRGAETTSVTCVSAERSTEPESESDPKPKTASESPVTGGGQFSGLIHRHMNQLFIRGDNVVMVSFLDCS